MIAAQGILTSAGGTNSHAAVVAVGKGIPAVCGADAIKIDLDARAFSANGTTVREGDTITIDGFTGNVFVGELPLTDSVLEKARQGDAAAQDQPIWRAYDRLMRSPTTGAGSASVPTPTRRSSRRTRGSGARGDRPVPHRAHVLGPSGSRRSSR
jgi:pyruvate,orthophosphate dikinase